MPAYTFRANQKSAADRIVQAFTTHHYALLWALCQSGKTGTFHWAAKQMLAAGTVKRVYLLCGSAEVCLRTQAEADAIDCNPDLTSPLKFNEEERVWRRTRSTVQVIFRPSFKKTHLDIKDALIIIDESHLDQSKGMELDQLLTRHGLVLTGDCPTAVANRCRILSVSATPYAEVSAYHSRLAAGLVADKAIVRLEPGTGYYGIEQFLRDGRIKSTESDLNLSTATGPQIAAFLKKPEFALKWNIMRVKNAIHLRAITKAAKSVGIFVKSYTAKSTDLAITEAERKERVDEQVAKAMRNTPKAKQTEAWEAAIRAKAIQDHPWLGVAPLRTTVILLKDRLRAGKVVPKDHIGFVWEDSASSKTDVLVQALLGRMCGYYAAGTYKPLIYLPKAVLEEHEGKVIKASELQRAISHDMIPHSFAHSSSGALHKAPSHGLKQCVPVKFYLPALANGTYTSPTDLKKKAFTALGHLFQTETDAFEMFTDEQRAKADRYVRSEIAAIDFSADIRQRHLQIVNGKPSHPHWWPKLRDAERTRTSMHGLGDEISNPQFLNFAFVHSGYSADSRAGDVYAIFYMKDTVPTKFESLSLKHRFGATDTLEVYSPGEAPEPTIWGSGQVAAASVGLPKACFSDSALFFTEFGKILASGLHIKGTCIEDTEVGYFTFQRDSFREANSLETICKDLGDSVGKKITIRYHPEVAGLTRKHTFRVTRISWSSAEAIVTEDPI
jgi:hypothetical protein